MVPSQKPCDDVIAHAWRCILYTLSSAISTHCLGTSVVHSLLFSPSLSFSTDPFLPTAENESESNGSAGRNGTSESERDKGMIVNEKGEGEGIKGDWVKGEGVNGNGNGSGTQGDGVGVSVNEKDEEAVCRALCFLLPLLWIPHAALG